MYSYFFIWSPSNINQKSFFLLSKPKSELLNKKRVCPKFVIPK